MTPSATKIFGSLLILLFVFFCLMSRVMLDFIFFYPMFMSFVWIVGGLYFYFHWERPNTRSMVTQWPADAPMLSIIIPCYNEGLNVDETIGAAAKQTYPNFEIIAVNDGSKDDTGAILDSLTEKYPMLRVIHLASNQGKAMALRMGTLAARSEYLVCIDGDALLDSNAAGLMIKPLIDNPRVGAVTGNPRIRTRSTLLGRIQVGEFSSIVGLIKRSQRVYGNIFTISGVIASFRRSALHDSGYWSLNMITEDIDVSWMMELRHWQIQYEPRALCWILMPETFKGLWKQRLRWAQGGAEVYLKNIGRVWHWRHHRMWALVLDYCMSAAWANAFVLSLILWGLGRFMAMPEGLNVPSIYPPAFWGILLATICILQILTALFIESHYEKNLVKTLGWTIWYPLVFWFLTMSTAFIGFPKALFKNYDKRGTWSTTDRGLR
jgi:biofilm PGA synthesis N-glycosyltransferase PgaC